jgi:hypothetical protein
MKIAYLDAFSGISGDMTVGALLHVGLPLAKLQDAIAALGLADVTLSAEPVTRSGITATKFHVRVRGEHPEHAHGDHAHRPYAAIRDLLARSTLADVVKRAALAIFARLAEAEGRVHGVAPDAVEFHEVGALDAIVDVVGVALGFAHLGVDAVYAAPLPLGQGRVRSAHGPPGAGAGRRRAPRRASRAARGRCRRARHADRRGDRRRARARRARAGDAHRGGRIRRGRAHARRPPERAPDRRRAGRRARHRRRRRPKRRSTT